MGVLDDAIREHLELKRQHGAEELELAQTEAEALGPARRDPPPEEGVAAEEGPAAGEAGLVAEASAPEAAERDEAYAEPAPEEAGWVEAEPPPPREAFAEDYAPPIQFTRDEAPPPDFLDSDEPLAPALPPTSQHESPAAEDVLEETPDFLQDTPEHERLWFEQKPPRDFDFDD